jgi:hypothetical protein
MQVVLGDFFLTRVLTRLSRMKEGSHRDVWRDDRPERLDPYSLGRFCMSCGGFSTSLGGVFCRSPRERPLSAWVMLGETSSGIDQGRPTLNIVLLSSVAGHFEH